MSSGLPLSLAAVAGITGLGLATRRGSTARPSTLLESVDDLLVNPNLDAICDLAVLVDRYPNPTKAERAILRKNRDAMSRIREGEPTVLLDMLTEVGIPWQIVGQASRTQAWWNTRDEGGLVETVHASFTPDWIGAVPDGWVRDAVESADVAIASCGEPLATSGIIRRLRDAAATRDRAACDRLLGRWDRPYLPPGLAHAFHASLAAARVFRVASTGRGAAGNAVESPVDVAWHHAGNAAAHARPSIGTAARMDDRIRCGRRLVLRAVLAAPPEMWALLAQYQAQEQGQAQDEGE